MSESPKDLELFHYGIKGMKWGVRRKEGKDGTVKSAVKASKKAPKKGIRARIRERDESIDEARGKIISSYKTEGSAIIKSAKATTSALRNPRSDEKRDAARSAGKERRAASKARADNNLSAGRTTSKEVAIKGALWLGPALVGTATLTAGTLATRKNARVGREFAAGIFSDTRGLPAPGTIALQLVDGVWQ